VQVSPIRTVDLVVLGGLGVLTLGCSWVPLTDAGRGVRVLEANAAADCQKVSTVDSKTADRVVVFSRTDRKMREELESLARNEAAEDGGNAIVPLGPMENGRQSFAIYRCP
jgi:hypothetical protein